MSALSITVNGQTKVIQLGSLSAAVNQQITQAVASASASAATATQQAGIATDEALAAAGSAAAAANAYAAIANGTASPAGTLTGTETVPLSRGAGLLQTTWNTVATFILTIFTILIVSGPGAVARTIIAKLLEMPVSPEDFGAAGNGTTDDTVAYTMACLSSRKVRLARGKTYLINHATLMSVSNFELDGNGASIVSNQTTSILGFNATLWGASSNIYVHDLTLSYTNNPNVRMDNVTPLWFQSVNGVKVERVTVLNSWSAAILFIQCSNVLAINNSVSNTLADGITAFGCGRNVKFAHNLITNSGDDAMAVTWLQGNTAAAVGETTIRTKMVSIHDNMVKMTNTNARGIFIGGIEGGTIHDNVLSAVSTIGIVLYNDTTVSTWSQDVTVHDNTVVDAGQAATSTFAEIGGIAVYGQNLRIKVHSNAVRNANNVGILIQGNAYVDNNLVDTVTNNPSTQNPTLTWKGVGIVAHDPNGTNTCYGTINNNRVQNTVNRAVEIGAGYNAQYLEVCDNSFSDCVDPVAVGNAALGVLYFEPSCRVQVLVYRNRFQESRSTQTCQTAVYVAGGGLHEVDENTISLPPGGTYPKVPIAIATGGTAIKRYLQPNVSTGTIPANSTYSIIYSIAECHLGDQVFIAAPYQTPGVIISGFMQNTNQVELQVTNPTTAPITPLQGGGWTIRVRRP